MSIFNIFRKNKKVSETSRNMEDQIDLTAMEEMMSRIDSFTKIADQLNATYKQALDTASKVGVKERAFGNMWNEKIQVEELTAQFMGSIIRRTDFSVAIAEIDTRISLYREMDRKMQGTIEGIIAGRMS